MHVVVVTPRAARDLRGLPYAVLHRIDRTILELCENPYRPGVVHFQGDAVADFRIRVGDYRILYDIDSARRCIVIVRVGHRREIYR